MTYEARPNGAHVFTCNVEGCIWELLAPTEVDLKVDAAHEGWVQGPQGHICPNCTHGIHIAASAAQAVLNQLGIPSGEVRMYAPGPVATGDPVMHFYDNKLHEVGTYLEGGTQGDVVRVQLKLPQAPGQAPISKELQAVLRRARGQDAQVQDAAPDDGSFAGQPLALPASFQSERTPEEMVEMTDLFGFLDKGGTSDN